MDHKELSDLINAANERYAAMTPAERHAHDEAQRQSWLRGMAPCEHGVRDWEDCLQCREKALAKPTPLATVLREIRDECAVDLGFGSVWRDALERSAEALEKAEAVIGPFAKMEMALKDEPDNRIISDQSLKLHTKLKNYYLARRDLRDAADWLKQYGRKDNG